jgi:hypothetical protein
MTIDYRYENLYFIDKRKYLLGMTDYLGNHKILMSDNKNLFYFSKSMAIFRNKIFWSSLNNLYSIPINGDPYNLEKEVKSNFIDCLSVFD